MSADIARLTGNACDPGALPRFAAIIGASPSKGARSPALWNAAFAAHGVDAAMLPMDVTPDNLVRLLEVLEADTRFIGAAVAVPYKEDIARWLGARLTPEAKAIGAVNCFYRGADGGLMGTNTDGEGARVSFESAHGPLSGKSVLLLGAGGAGKAVAAFLKGAVGATGRFALAGRSDASRQYAARLGVRYVPWSDVASELPAADVLVNCTSVGSGANVGSSPLSVAELGLLRADAIVFDIIHVPYPSELVKLARARGLAALGGLPMNLEQAILGYGHAAPAPRGPAVTRSAMQAAFDKLSK